MDNQLLGQQIAEAAGSLDRSDTAITIQALSPVEKSLSLRTVSRKSQLSQHHLGFVDRHRSMGCLMRVDSNRRDHQKTSLFEDHLGSHGGHS